MINYYQPYLLPFLRPAVAGIPAGIRRTYFLSFEDALWVLLRNRKIREGSTVLVPDFYCEDVTDNIRDHGYVPVRYPLDAGLRIRGDMLAARISRYKPAVVILFHACGMDALPAASLTGVVRRYRSVLFVEDSVQRLTDPGSVILHTGNHVRIDSLRKVLPLPGSFLYYRFDGTVTPDPMIRGWKYVAKSLLYYVRFRIRLIMGFLTRNARLIESAHTRTLKRHDDLIGDSAGGFAGPMFVPRIHSLVDFPKVSRLKQRQANTYAEELTGAGLPARGWRLPELSPEESGMLHAYPLFVDRGIRSGHTTIEEFLLGHGIVSWFKFPDTPWSRRRGVLFLPLGFHIKTRDIRHIAGVLSRCPIP